MSKTYTLLLNSSNAVNRSGTTTTDYTYYVNWASFLPKEVKNFDVSFSLKSFMTAAPQLNVVVISANLGNQTIYDQSYSQTPIICAITPKSNAGSTVYYYYESLITDESGFMISYPQNNYLNIRVLSPLLDGAGNYELTPSFPNYILQLSFTEIEEDEE